METHLPDVIAGLITRRKRLGVSREKLAVAAGVSGNTVVRIEAGQVKPYALTVAALTEALEKFEARAGHADPEKTSGAGGGRDEE